MMIVAILFYSVLGFIMTRIIDGKMDFLKEIKGGGDIIFCIVFWPFILAIIASVILWRLLSKILWFLWNKESK